MIRLRHGKWRAARLGAGRLLGRSPARVRHRLLPRPRSRADRRCRSRRRRMPIVPLVQRAVVGGAVDPAGEARDDHQSLCAETVRETAGEAARRRRGIARADDGDRARSSSSEVALRDQ